MISIKILSKKVTVESNGKKKTFLRYFTRVKMLVKGEEDKGKVSKSLTVKFTQDASKLLPKEARFFTVNVTMDQLSCPRIYEVKVEEDKDGNEIKKFPTIWIRGFSDYKELPTKPITDDVDFETEETETEEHEIGITEDNIPF